MNAKTILKSTGKFFKDLWGYIEPHLNSVAEFLLHHKWWGIAGVFCLAVIPLFISFHYEKGLDTGNAIFFSIAIFIGACIVAILSILALCLIGVIIRGCIEYFKKSDDDTPDESSEKKAATELGPIDTATLEKYFKPSFRGAGGKFNQFRVLVDMLEGVRKESSRNVGAVALLIYESDQMSIRKPSSFKKWIDIFFECMGLEKPKDKSPNKYRLDRRKDNDMKMIMRFHFL